MDEPLKIIYVGPLIPGGTCRQRQSALEDLGHHLRLVDTMPPAAQKQRTTLLYRLRRRLIGPRDLAGANAAIRRWIEREPADLLWIDKGLTIEARTLRQVKDRQPECRIVGYSPDDMLNPNNQSRQWREHLPWYDVFFTTKSFGVAELKALGCRHVEFVANAYDPATHRPTPVTAQDRQRLGGPVGFIGHYEPQRGATLYRLAQRGISVRVWGERWHRAHPHHPNLRLERRPVWGEDYARALCAFDINLGFLSKQNRDLSTTRSVEIPACGAFMLAERTPEHTALFREDQEAGFFDTEAELLAKVSHYLAHDQQRRQIAAAGRQRCLRAGYSYPDRLRHMLHLACN